MARARVRIADRVGDVSDRCDTEETMSSTASLITVLAASVGGLIVIGIGHFIFGEKPS
jgi:hypothetical protein